MRLMIGCLSVLLIAADARAEEINLRRTDTEGRRVLCPGGTPVRIHRPIVHITEAEHISGRHARTPSTRWIKPRDRLLGEEPSL